MTQKTETKACDCGNPECKGNGATLLSSAYGVSIEVATRAINLAETKKHAHAIAVQLGVDPSQFVALAYLEGYRDSRKDMLQ